MTLATVQQTLRQYKRIYPGEPFIVGVSGGADSLALMHILAQLMPDEGFELHIATLDHGLRGAAGAADAAFVEALAQRWGLPATRGQADVPAHAQAQGIGLEAAARQLRYTFLAQTAQAQGSHLIMVGHHADDQAETILMHLLRGAGLVGLQGMTVDSPVPSWPQMRLLRPLLSWSRAAIEEYCAVHNLQSRYDDSNADTVYQRNYLRIEIMPRLNQINPQLSAALQRMADLARQDMEFIESAYDIQVQPHVARASTHTEIPLAIWLKLHPSLQSRWLLREAAHLAPEAELNAVTIAAALELMQDGHVGQLALLPGGLQVRRAYSVLLLEIADKPAALPLAEPARLQITFEAPLRVQVPGTTRLSDDLLLHVRPAPAEGQCLRLPVGAELWLRNRLPGDRFEAPGLSGKHQKLKKWLIDHKVPQQLRDTLPLLIIDQSVVAIIDFERWIVAHSHQSQVPSEDHYCFLLEHLKSL